MIGCAAIILTGLAYKNENQYLLNGLNLLKNFIKYSIDNQGFPKSRNSRQLIFYLKYFICFKFNMSELATERVNNKVIDLVSIFKNNINKNNGITKIDNMLLSAIEAQNNNEPEYLILACLFHELGYYLRNEYLNFHDIHNHNLIATDYLMNLGMNARVCYLVEKFLESKRYLYTINAEMYNNLPYLEKRLILFGNKSAIDYNDFKTRQHIKVKCSNVMS